MYVCLADQTKSALRMSGLLSADDGLDTVPTLPRVSQAEGGLLGVIGFDRFRDNDEKLARDFANRERACEDTTGFLRRHNSTTGARIGLCLGQRLFGEKNREDGIVQHL